MRGPFTGRVEAASSPTGPAYSATRFARLPSLISPAARKALRQRMLLQRQASLTRVAAIAGVPPEALRRWRTELHASGLADLLLARGADSAFITEFPHGPLLYLLVRALHPQRVLETGVRPGYTTAWILGALHANGTGELTSLGPGTAAGRAIGVEDVAVGQFVPPPLRSRWTLVLGNTEERLRSVLAGLHGIDLFVYDNGPDPRRARFELKSAWEALAEDGVLLAHRIDANSAWMDFCGLQGLPPQVLDHGPPPLGALAMRRGSAT